MVPKALKTEIKGSLLFMIEVVGESFFQDNLRRIAAKKNAQIQFNGSDAMAFQVCANIVSEPDNPHDSNAIQVLIDDLKVGYLDRTIAARLTAQIKKRGFDRIDATCLSLVNGVYRTDTEEYLFGVRLDIDSQSQRRQVNKNLDVSDFEFLVVNQKDGSVACEGDKVSLWPHPTKLGQIRIYFGSGDEGLVGFVPLEFAGPIRHHLNAGLRVESSIGGMVKNIFRVKCRLVPESETVLVAEKILRERRVRLESSLSKPYRPKKPMSFNFNIENANLKKGDSIEVVGVPAMEMIIAEYGRLPVEFRCLRTGIAFESTCEHDVVEKLVRLRIETKAVIAKITKTDVSWYSAEVSPTDK